MTIAVAFAMHCFTKDAAMADPSADTYSDERETRAFCSDRYQLSKLLPALVRGLASSACQFAKADNYVVVETADQEGNARLYGVFFNVKKWKAEDGPCVLLTVQSAYPFSPSKPQPGQGKIRFTRLIELTLDGVKPQKPRR
ncbi:hypothetical protein ABS755_13675 [Castellaniella sp. FW104-16D08]|uniref:hypothetical protein n=1 Tax=unclassified Castellaniella TaxID=2617606 RepID=UPI0033148DE5